jgi:hypothetical protein
LILELLLAGAYTTEQEIACAANRVGAEGLEEKNAAASGTYRWEGESKDLVEAGESKKRTRAEEGWRKREK